MKRQLVLLVAATALSVPSIPAMATEYAGHAAVEQRCGDDLLSDCANQVDTLQQRIQKLQNALTLNADKYTRDEINTLKEKLADAQATLRNLEHR